MKKIIYDFGANNGDDIPYYLQKADLVVAVEANPILCKKIRDRFMNEIIQQRLIVVEAVLTDGKTESRVVFYLHKTRHFLSQFPKPELEIISQFDPVLLPSISIIEIISKYGDPYYIKIDVEHYDEVILLNLFENNIRPPFISAESHNIKVFSLLVALGHYDCFKLVDGHSVVEKYKNHEINTLSGKSVYSFPYHSAGPFGEDIEGEWMTANNFFKLFGLVGLGWKDIHAANSLKADPKIIPVIESNGPINIKLVRSA
tara:strand:- start:15 stop:788 length:774 start_codon:yes stop_codon:yes gene_type:complete